MKRIIYMIVGLIALLGIAGAITFFAFPQVIVSAVQSQAASAARLSKKELTVNGYNVHYYEGGSGPTVVLLHGMADEKNSFVNAAKALTGTHHVILPDLMGHGENARDPKRDYSIRGQVEFLHAFLSAKGVRQFALGGNSMGGHTSAAYALAYPAEVNRLVLVNAPGLTLDDHIVYAGFPGKFESVDDYYKVVDRVFYKRPALPGPVVEYMMAETNKNIGLINDMAKAITQGEDFDLKDRIGDIAVPTLILWGQHDKVVRFNVAEGYHADIEGSQLVMIDNAGHSPQLEVPDRTGAELAKFLKSAK